MPMFTDNYGLLLVDELDQDPLLAADSSVARRKRSAACVDPGDGDAILRAVEALDLDLKVLLCTHKHADHIGGNAILRKSLPSLHIIGTAYEEIPEVDTKAKDGDIFHFGGLEIETIHAPCHTKGHVLYFVRRSPSASLPSTAPTTPILFSGDTLFVGGCGRFFEGTASDMLKNMDRIASLPAETHVFCAHEYTESNLRFLVSVDGGNEACVNMFDEVKEKRSRNVPTLPTTLERELTYNLFMKCREPRTQTLLGCRNAEEAMGTLRKRKNDFK